MKYVGGKTRLMKHLKPIIESFLKPHSYYVEPFVGGGNSFIKVNHDRRLGMDVNSDLIDLHRYLRDTPDLDLPYITQDLYKECGTNPDKFPPYMRAYINICCSFQGKYRGGYARPSTGKGRYRDYPREAIESLVKSKPLYNKDDIFLCEDYSQVVPSKDMVIYCDPPYAGTTGYISGTFDHNTFWETVRVWSQVCTVLVSEYTYPEDFTPLWQKPRKQSLGLTNGSIKTESLVILKGKEV